MRHYKPRRIYQTKRQKIDRDIAACDIGALAVNAENLVIFTKLFCRCLRVNDKKRNILPNTTTFMIYIPTRWMFRMFTEHGTQLFLLDHKDCPCKSGQLTQLMSRQKY
uniref:DUF192 domain-containing protein n=1 Tax=Romanomermis culicivorax TaxID=13658 RepID=A0A915HVZ1_ROMCU